jgi:hypothetical protein
MQHAIRRGRVRLHGRLNDAFIVEYSRRRTLLMAILCGGFAVLGLLILVFGDGPDRFWGGICLIFFGGGTIVLGTQVRRPARIALAAAGLYSESRFAHAFVPWNAIAGVGRAHFSGQEMLTVDVSDASRIETSRGIGWLKGLNQSMDLPDFALPISLLGSRADVLERALAHYVDHAEDCSRIGTVDELQRLARVSGAEDQSASSPRGRSDLPNTARWILWVGGSIGLFFSIGAVLSDVDPERRGSRMLGALLFGTTSVAALGSAWLLPRQPRIARVLGILAAAGGMFLGWLVTQTADTLPRVLVGVAIAGGAAFVAWSLARWSWRRAGDEKWESPGKWRRVRAVWDSNPRHED